MYRKIVALIGFLCLVIAASAQTDSAMKPAPVAKPDTVVNISPKPDSAAVARWKHRRDSLKAIGDSLSMVWIKPPNPNRPDRFIDSLIDLYQVKNLDFNAWAHKFTKKVNHDNEGKVRRKGEPWILGFTILLLLLFGLVKKYFSKELEIIIEAFYSKRMLTQVNKEDNLFNSWPFLFLYLLFGFTIGVFLYLCGKFYQLTYEYDGIQWLFVLSVLVIGLFTLKIIALRLLGFVFGIQKMVREYVSVLYLAYFNVAILFLPVILAFALTPFRYAQIYIYLSLIIVAAMFTFQFFRAGATILSGYKFSKVYLFLYLCALEFCPFLLLIKALRY